MTKRQVRFATSMRTTTNLFTTPTSPPQCPQPELAVADVVQMGEGGKVGLVLSL